ncbi:MAG: YHS domain-containing protein [Chloroflexi bacterium]|nr:YHS domain-containing protein [Chloroflexota bacterium]
MPFWSKKKEKVKDPVCGMEVDPGKAAATHDYQSKTYYFCSPSCKSSFVKEPGKYVKGPPAAAGGMSGHH